LLVAGADGLIVIDVPVNAGLPLVTELTGGLGNEDDAVVGRASVMFERFVELRLPISLTVPEAPAAGDDPGGLVGVVFDMPVTLLALTPAVVEAAEVGTIPTEPGVVRLGETSDVALLEDLVNDAVALLPVETMELMAEGDTTGTTPGVTVTVMTLVPGLRVDKDKDRDGSIELAPPPAAASDEIGGLLLSRVILLLPMWDGSEDGFAGAVVTSTVGVVTVVNELVVKLVMLTDVKLTVTLVTTTSVEFVNGEAAVVAVDDGPAPLEGGGVRVVTEPVIGTADVVGRLPLDSMALPLTWVTPDVSAKGALVVEAGAELRKGGQP